MVTYGQQLPVMPLVGFWAPEVKLNALTIWAIGAFNLPSYSALSVYLVMSIYRKTTKLPGLLNYISV